MNADQLVQQALEALKAEDYPRAKALLKKAASVAPLRSDIRELMVYAIERHQPENNFEPASPPEPEPPRPRRTAPSRPIPTRRQAAPKSSWILWLVGVLILLGVLAGLAVAGYFLLIRPPDTVGDEEETIASREDSGTPARENGTVPPAVRENRERLYQLAHRYAQEENYRQAIETMEALIEKDPPEADAYRQELAKWYFAVAMTQYDLREYAAATEDFQHATKLHGTSTEYHFWLGQTYYLKGRNESGSQKKQALNAARESLEEAIRIDPENLKAYDILAKTQIALGSKIQGVECFQEIIRRAPPESFEARRARENLRNMGAPAP